MAEVNIANLKPYPKEYQSTRGVGDVLIGDDTGLPLITASSTGDITALRDILERSPEIALESRHRIYQEFRPASDENKVRTVLAMERTNLYQALLGAAENGHAAAVSTLLDFALQHNVKLSSEIDRVTIKKTIDNRHAAVFEVLAKAEPTVATFNINHGKRPLDFAIALNDHELATVILQQGGGRQFPSVHGPVSYQGSRLCQAARFSKKMTALLVQYGYTVRGSGALQMAVGRGAIDTIRFLVEEHGADVNEQLPAATLPRVDNALYASWTPMHFAARSGQEEAMKLLESYGAKTDVLDVNGKTPLRLLEERKEARAK